MGVLSYFLIGYYVTRPSASRVALHAVVLNRFGDFAIICAVALLVQRGLPLELDLLLILPELVPESFIVLMAIASVAKSAQLGLHTWLPNAMEGPTPVSSLLHAATMVCAGVILLFRVNVVLGGTTLSCLAIIGGLTLITAALTALHQPDFKRVVAYSTLSQLGYMVLAVSLPLPEVALFHM